MYIMPFLMFMLEMKSEKLRKIFEKKVVKQKKINFHSFKIYKLFKHIILNAAANLNFLRYFLYISYNYDISHNVLPEKIPNSFLSGNIFRKF